MIHHRLLFQLLKHSWMIAHSLPKDWSPLQALRVRHFVRASAAYRAFMLKFDEKERWVSWRHRARGTPPARWDSILEHLLGPTWLSQLSAVPWSGFRAFAAIQIDAACAVFHLPGLSAPRVPGLLALTGPPARASQPPAHSVGRSMPPAEPTSRAAAPAASSSSDSFADALGHLQTGWSLPGRQLLAVVDARAVADTVTGKASLAEPSLRPLLEAILGRLSAAYTARLWRSHPAFDAVVWTPRELNKAADALANLAMDRRSSFCYRHCGLLPPPSSCNVLCMSDGGLREEGVASFAWAVWLCPAADENTETPLLLAAAGTFAPDVRSVPELELLGLQAGLDEALAFLAGAALRPLWNDWLPLEDLPDLLR